MPGRAFARHPGVYLASPRVPRRVDDRSASCASVTWNSRCRGRVRPPAARLHFPQLWARCIAVPRERTAGIPGTIPSAPRPLGPRSAHPVSRRNANAIRLNELEVRRAGGTIPLIGSAIRHPIRRPNSARITRFVHYDPVTRPGVPIRAPSVVAISRVREPTAA